MSLEILFSDRKIRKCINEELDRDIPTHVGKCDICGEEDYLHKVFDKEVCNNCIKDIRETVEDYSTAFLDTYNDIEESAKSYINEQYVRILPDLKKLSDDADNDFNGSIPDLMRSYGLRVSNNWNRSIYNGMITIDGRDMESGNTRVNQFFIDYDVAVNRDKTYDLLKPDSDGTLAPKNLASSHRDRKKDNVEFAKTKPWYRDKDTVVQVGRGRPVADTSNTNVVFQRANTKQVNTVNNRANKKAPKAVPNNSADTTISTVNVPSTSTVIGTNPDYDYEFDINNVLPVLLPPYNTLFIKNLGKVRLTFLKRDKNNKVDVVLVSFGKVEYELELDSKYLENINVKNKKEVEGLYKKIFSEYFKEKFDTLRDNKSKYPEYAYTYHFENNNVINNKTLTELDINLVITYLEDSIDNGSIDFKIENKDNDNMGSRVYSYDNKYDKLSDFFDIVTDNFVISYLSSIYVNNDKAFVGDKNAKMLKTKKLRASLANKLASKFVKDNVDVVPELEDLDVVFNIAGAFAGSLDRNNDYGFISGTVIDVYDAGEFLFDTSKEMLDNLKLDKRLKSKGIKLDKGKVIKNKDYPAVEYKVEDIESFYNAGRYNLFESYFRRINELECNE